MGCNAEQELLEMGEYITHGARFFFEIIFSLPFFLWFLVSNYTEGTLTVSFTLAFLIEATAVGSRCCGCCLVHDHGAAHKTSRRQIPALTCHGSIRPRYLRAACTA
jgi:hypothetical protein